MMDLSITPMCCAVEAAFIKFWDLQAEFYELGVIQRYWRSKEFRIKFELLESLIVQYGSENGRHTERIKRMGGCPCAIREERKSRDRTEELSHTGVTFLAPNSDPRRRLKSDAGSELQNRATDDSEAAARVKGKDE